MLTTNDQAANMRTDGGIRNDLEGDSGGMLSQRNIGGIKSIRNSEFSNAGACQSNALEITRFYISQDQGPYFGGKYQS